MAYSSSPANNNEHNPPPTPPKPRASQGLRHMGAEVGLLLLCLFLFFWQLGNAPLLDLDEALYVTCAQQMVVSGDWVTPRLNTRQPERPGVTAIPFFEKPILVYWASAGSMRLFGRNLWAARLPTALASLLTTLAIVVFGRRWFTRRAGLLAGLVYATAPMTLVDARQMTTDALLVLWFTLALFCFWHIKAQDIRVKIKDIRQEMKNARNRPKRDPLLTNNSYLISFILYLISCAFFWLMCALSVLTKGIVGLLLPLLIIGVYALLDRVLLRVRLKTPLGPRLRFALKLRPPTAVCAQFKRLRPVPGLLLFLAVAAPWHLRIVGSPERDAQGRTWVMEYIQRQHIGRFKGLDTVHNQPLPTYFVYFLLFFFPWAGFAPAAFRLLREEKEKRRKGEKETKGNAERGMMNDESESHSSFITHHSSFPALSTINYQLSTFLLVWFWTLFVFFSIGAAKLPTYIAPAYPAAALLTGRWLDSVLFAMSQNEQAQDERERNERLRNIRWLRRGALCALGIGLLLLCALPFAPRFAPPQAPLPVGVVPLAWHLALTLTLGSAIAWFCFRGISVERQALSVEQEASSVRSEPPTTNHQPPITNHQSKIENRKSKIGVGGLVAMMTVVVGILGGEGYAVLHSSVLGPYQEVAAAARPDAAQGIPVVYYNVVPRRPSMNFYAGYAPFEHKEVPLLPFLARCLPSGRRATDVVLTQDAYTRLLTPEIKATPGASLQLLLRRGPNGEWVLARLSLPANYNPPHDNLPAAISP